MHKPRSPIPIALPGPGTPARFDTADGSVSFRVAGAYLIVGLAWVVGSDWALVGGEAFRPSVVKGAAFVLTSSVLIFWLVRRATRRLSQANRFFRAVADGTTDAVFVKDAKGKYLLFNEAAAQFVGKPVADVLGRDDTALFDADSARAVMDRDRAVMAAGHAETREEHLAVGGMTRTYLATKAPFRDDDGAVIGLIGISRDITDRKRMEEHLLASERRFRELADAIPQIVWTAGPDGGLTHLNAQATEFSGVAAGGLTAWNWKRLIHPDDLARTVACWAETIRTGVPQDIEFRIRRADGAYRWHITRQVPSRDAAGRITAWYGTCTDIEDIKRAERTIRDERAVLRTLVDSIPDLIFTKDAEGRFDLCNNSVLAFAGVKTEADLRGKTVFDLFPPEHAKSYDDDDRRVLAGGETISDREEFARDATGRDTWRLVTKAPLKDHDGRIVGLVGISRNIQQRKEREQLLVESQERLSLALAAAQMGTWDWDLGTDQVVRSSGYLRILGLEAHGSRRGEFAQMVYPEDRATVFATLRAAIAERSTFSQEFRVVRADGRVRWVNDIGKALYDDAGKAVRMIGLMQDVTDRKEAEAAVRESRAMLRLVLDNIPQGVFWKDRESRYLGCNRVVARANGLPDPDAIVGLRSADLPSVAPEEAAFFRQKDLEVMTRGEAQHHIIEKMTIQDGRTIWLDTNKMPIFDAAGEVVGILGTWEDITERRAAEEALREERDRFAKIAATAPGVICSFRVRPDGTMSFPYASPRIADIYELPPESLAADASAIFEKIAPDDVPRIQVSIARSAQTMTPWHDTFRVRRARGGDVWIEGRSTPTREPDGGTLWHGFLNDVTDRRQDEAVVRFQHALLRAQAEASPDGMLIVGGGDRVLSYNQRFLETWGVPEHLVATGDDAPILARVRTQAEDPEAFTRRVMDIYADPEAKTHEEVRLADGRTLDRYSGPIRGADGELLGRVWYFRDITARKRTEGELDRQRRELQLIFDSVPALIFYKDLDHRLVRVNQELVRLVGRPRAEIEGRTDAELDSPHAEQYWRDEQEIMATGRAKRGILEPLATATGRRWIQTDKLPHHDEGGRIIGILGFALDVTQRKQLEEQFLQSQKMEAVGRLAGGVAHDFNNLLTVINGYSDLLLMDLPANDAQRESIATIRDAGERAARLTQQMLAFSRKAILEPKVLNLNELVADTAKLLRRLIGEDIILTVVPDPALERIKADPGQLEQVILNLAVNARDAMPTGGRLTIQNRMVVVGEGDGTNDPTLTPGPYAQLSVTDTGGGMTDEVKGKVFEPFFTTKPLGKGTGLGLAVVHGVVMQCGGHIRVESAVGAGTTFRLLFPTVEDRPAGQDSGFRKGRSAGHETVLLVEDEEAVRKIARISLESQGFKVIAAANGADAIRLVEGHAGPLDVLVTDVVMPEMGGRQLVEAIRGHRPGVRVLFMSGYTDDAVLLHGVVEATDAFLQKPFTPLGLARKVRAVLDGG